MVVLFVSESKVFLLELIQLEAALAADRTSAVSRAKTFVTAAEKTPDI